MTKGPFQPVRLYYSLPGQASATKVFHHLDCVQEARIERCWQWLFEAESAALTFHDAGYQDVPESRRPIILGRFRFPKGGGMTLETNSIQRAIEGARFFRPRLGPKIELRRCRVVNRLFSADEGGPKKLMKTLNQNVTKIDPRQTELQLTRDFESLDPNLTPEQAAQALLKKRRARKEDVPMVEDFPLYPEDETDELQDLATSLTLRQLRALEHWNGNSHLTLTDIIMRTVQ